MADMVHPDQTYTVPGRSIFDNLFLVRDLLELGRRDGLSFALLSLDQEKAFDRVDHGYLLSTLQAFGFGPQFVSFLRVLYASAECLVRLNWTLTEPVSFGRGVRQGCPLSGQLYALAIEPFLCLLRRRMTGLVLREPELRLVLSAYADDVLLVVQDPGDLARVEACQAIYSAASSARVNWVKSSGLAVGDWRQSCQASQADGIREKYLRASIHPDLQAETKGVIKGKEGTIVVCSFSLFIFSQATTRAEILDGFLFFTSEHIKVKMTPPFRIHFAEHLEQKCQRPIAWLLKIWLLETVFMVCPKQGKHISQTPLAECLIQQTQEKKKNWLTTRVSSLFACALDYMQGQTSVSFERY
ncbi:unnamed protein product [Caretta caretta]